MYDDRSRERQGQQVSSTTGAVNSSKE